MAEAMEQPTRLGNQADTADLGAPISALDTQRGLSSLELAWGPEAGSQRGSAA